MSLVLRPDRDLWFTEKEKPKFSHHHFTIIIKISTYVHYLLLTHMQWQWQTSLHLYKLAQAVTQYSQHSHRSRLNRQRWQQDNLVLLSILHLRKEELVPKEYFHRNVNRVPSGMRVTSHKTEMHVSLPTVQSCVISSGPWLPNSTAGRRAGQGQLTRSTGSCGCPCWNAPWWRISSRFLSTDLWHSGNWSPWGWE